MSKFDKVLVQAYSTLDETMKVPVAPGKEAESQEGDGVDQNELNALLNSDDENTRKKGEEVQKKQKDLEDQAVKDADK